MTSTALGYPKRYVQYLSHEDTKCVLRLSGQLQAILVASIVACRVEASIKKVLGVYL